MRPYIENQNKSTDEGIEKTFIYEGRWQRKGKNYVKDVLIDSTVIDGPVTERASVEVYNYYIHEDDFAMPSYLNEKELENLESFAINALIRRLNKDVEKFFEDIFGKNDETKDATDQDRGKFGAHVGESASPRSDMKPDMSKGEMFSGGGNGGSGEMGRLFQEYIYWNIREGTGVSSMNAAVWEKSLWHKKPGDWFDPPSIKSLASIALQVAGTIVGGPVAGALIGLIDDALFAMLDVAGGYKTPLEAGFEFGKQALMTAATSSLGGVYEGISKGIGGGISGVVGKTLVGAHQTITTGIVTSAIGAVNYSSEGGLSFSSESFTSGVTSSFKGALTGAVGTFTGGMMSHFNLGENLSKVTGFSSGNINDMQKLNNTIGGLAGQAVGFAMGEDFKFNLLNIADFGAGKNMGLLELSIGRKGVSAAIGSGGLDMSLGTIASTVRGAVAWDVNNKINATAATSTLETTTLANVLRYQYGFGDSTQKNQLFDVLAGNTVLQGSSGKKGEKAETVTADGKRVVTLAGYKEGMSAQEQMELAINFGHEAYRDGIVGPDNVLETREAVKGHTEMALRMTADKLYNKDAMALIGSNKNLQNDISAYAKGQDAFNAYVDGNYDSSADYWRLMEDGSLEYDGDGWLKNSKGYMILDKDGKPIGSQGIEGGLAKILNISNEDAAEMLKNYNFHDNNTKYNWLDDKNIGKAINLQQIGPASDYEGFSLGMSNWYNNLYEKRLEQYNTKNIYDNLVNKGTMDIGNNGNYISYEQYKTQNFIVGKPEYQTQDTYVEVPCNTVIGAQTGSGPVHRGTDSLAKVGTDAKLLIYNETSKVNRIDERTDTPQGKYIEVATTFTYNYMGQDYTETVFTRSLHMNSISVTVASELNYDTKLGETGKTGEWNGVAYGAHAHEDIYVANNNYKNATQGSPYLNYLSEKNGNVKIEHDNKVWYDKFLFADKSKYSFTPDAYSYK